MVLWTRYKGRELGGWGVVHSCVHVVHVSRGKKKKKSASDLPYIYLKVHFDNAVLVWYM